MNTAAQIESILFYKARPVKVSFLMQTLKLDRDAVLAGIAELTEQYGFELKAA